MCEGPDRTSKQLGWLAHCQGTRPCPRWLRAFAPLLTTVLWLSPTASRSAPAADPPSPEKVTIVKPALYVLAVGISNYLLPGIQLRYPAKDAVDLAAELKWQEQTLYRSVEARILTDQQATKNNILDGLEWLQRQSTAKDVAVLFLAGHAITDPSTKTYYFLPYEADPNAIKKTMLNESDIRTTLTNVAGKVLLFLDTCHSGKVFSSQTRDLIDIIPFIAELASADNGVVVFAASTGRQASHEKVEWNNGAFTRALIEGLQGHADAQHTGRVTLNMLDLYISERVKQLTQGLQTPTTAKPSTVPDFPVAVWNPGRVRTPTTAKPAPIADLPLAMNPGSLTPVESPLPRPPAAPIYRRWWFWLTLVGGAAIAAVALGTALSQPARDEAVPAGVPIFDQTF